ncbi:hypothetical protein Pla163_12810 [Planctomycetes bacterium Pla163]|uniref:Choice-of-anchor I domain-containing protein n=1 Tax=Rohdeia mirabilis TaxID=2528008 RepID=A0A518CY97_9BACT|nr:hypothetical protein Pla163_12810 [Planctomycetes bacterium Pla163]
MTHTSDHRSASSRSHRAVRLGGALLGLTSVCACGPLDASTPVQEATGAPATEHASRSVHLVAHPSRPTVDGAGSEIVSLHQASRRLAITSSDAGAFEVFDLSDPRRPRSIARNGLDLAEKEELTSLVVLPDGQHLALAIRDEPRGSGHRVEIRGLLDGALVARVPVGIEPDAVTASPDGSRLLVCDEAEDYWRATEAGYVSAPASLTVVDLSNGLAAASSERVALPNLSPEEARRMRGHGRSLERKVGGEMVMVPLERGDATQLEPEVAAFAPDGSFALATLQENNLVARIEFDPSRVVAYFDLGTNTGLFDVDDDGEVAFVTEMTGLREPDGIAIDPTGKFFVTADEGDTEPKASKSIPDLFAPGGRSVSVFDAATGELLGTTGDAIDRAAHAEGAYPDDRSDSKGSEPEMVTVFEGPGGTVWAAASLERANAVVLVDVTSPRAPRVVDVVAVRGPGPKAPEGIVHYLDARTGGHFLYTGNEVGGSLGVLEVVFD